MNLWSADHSLIITDWLVNRWTGGGHPSPGFVHHAGGRCGVHGPGPHRSTHHPHDGVLEDVELVGHRQELPHLLVRHHRRRPGNLFQHIGHHRCLVQRLSPGRVHIDHSVAINITQLRLLMSRETETRRNRARECGEFNCIVDSIVPCLIPSSSSSSSSSNQLYFTCATVLFTFDSHVLFSCWVLFCLSDEHSAIYYYVSIECECPMCV